MKCSPCVYCHIRSLTYIYKIFILLYPYLHIQVINVAYNGNIGRHMKCKTAQKHYLPKFHIFKKFKGNSSIMIIWLWTSYIIRIRYWWFQSTFCLNQLILFKNQLTLCLFSLIIQVTGALRKIVFLNSSFHSS